MPSPRTEDPGGSGAVLGFVAESLRRLEDQVTRGFDVVNAQLSKLPEQYVPRREFDRYRDEMAVDWQQAMQKHDTDIAGLRRDYETARNQASQFRRWLWGTGLAAAGVLAAGVGDLISQFSR